MRGEVLEIPEHLRDAIWKVESAGIPGAESDGLLVCGVGGSAIGGDLAIGALGHRLKRPLVVVRGYELPDFADQRWTALCCSFSGDTEEAVACWEQARERGLNRIVATTGGRLGELAREVGDPVIGLPGIIKQPRAAVGYMLVAALAAARASAAAPSMEGEVERAAAWLSGAKGEIEERSGELAARIDGRLPVVFGAGLTAPVARRWKTQFNENSKRHSFISELPEACHNEAVAWGLRRGECVVGGAADGGAPRGAGEAAREAGDPSRGAGDPGAGDPSRQAGAAHSLESAGWTASAPSQPGLHAILLADVDQHPRERRRIEILARMIDEAGSGAEIVETDGDTRTARVAYGVMLGDLLSLDLADRAGIQPDPIPPIDRIKAELG